MHIIRFVLIFSDYVTHLSKKNRARCAIYRYEGMWKMVVDGDSMVKLNGFYDPSCAV